MAMETDEDCLCEERLSSLESRVIRMEQELERVLEKLEKEQPLVTGDAVSASPGSALDTIILGQPGMAPPLPLHEAAETGNTMALVRALVLGADPNALDQSGDTALHCASRSGVALSSELLLASGASVNVQDLRGGTPLSVAVCRGHGSVVEALLWKGALLEQPDKEGRTPLMRAVVMRNVEMVTLLVKKGASVNTEDRNGNSPLVTAAKDRLMDILETLMRLSSPFVPQIVKAMTEAGSAAVILTLIRSNPSAATCSLENTMMVHAAQEGWMRPLVCILKNCVRHNCRFEVHNRNVSNSVLVAKTSEVLILLWKNTPKTTRRTAMYRAAVMGWDAVVELIVVTWGELYKTAYSEEVQAALAVAHTLKSAWSLLTACPRVARTSAGTTMVWRATNRGWPEILSFLIDNGVSVNLKRSDGSTPVHRAAARGHTECLEVLIMNGRAPIAEIDDDGWTPLHIAAESGHVEAVNLLLKCGADRTVKDPCGLTPCDVASTWAIVQLLKME